MRRSPCQHRVAEQGCYTAGCKDDDKAFAAFDLVENRVPPTIRAHQSAVNPHVVLRLIFERLGQFMDILFVVAGVADE